MSLRGTGPIDELAVPSGTTVEEHDLVTDGDVLVGSRSTVEFGLRGRNVALGERTTVEDDIEASGDCRVDTWCTVEGNVLVGEDAYIGERATITGRLMVSGDLDIGDDVTVEEGFEANGWIVVRNPIPTIVFYFIVLSQLLRSGETDAADELAAALADGDEARDPLVIPRGAEVSDDAWRVSTPATVGDDCRIHGNLRAKSVAVGERNTVFGSLRAREGITVGADTVIHGDVTSRGGTVRIEAGARVLGDVSSGDLVVHEDATIDGTLRARGDMRLVQRVAEPDEERADGEAPKSGEQPAAEESAAEESAEEEPEEREPDKQAPDEAGVDDVAESDDEGTDDERAEGTDDERAEGTDDDDGGADEKEAEGAGAGKGEPEEAKTAADGDDAELATTGEADGDKA
ncbi:polymer-forming cytoskeletal protein [Halorubrum vacuolatum]|uniref:Predicted acyltransferase, contains DUF342 domain n=1 Tax=Halorubrum vacuolatum TaxID=63740 RepID=A0A238VLW3_HALVU|nr:polymer-forming cytoskeletal protein [Halorubrum vacuolatum]SNR35161.1 Predicted acyltransferase, contains DUF342 domain [Halorubrum vacuolatum]